MRKDKPSRTAYKVALNTVTLGAKPGNVILTCYLIVGTYLEEKKLVLEFGDQYKAYQNSVSMLIPYKWLTSTLVKRSTD